MDSATTTRFYAQRDWTYSTGQFSIYAKHGRALLTEATLVFTDRDQLQEGVAHHPPLILTEADAQSLLQALWDAGLRPNSGESTMAHSEAVNKHLQDMRKLVAAKYKVDLK